MSRIRSVHPTLFTDETFMGLSMAARMGLIGIWCEADDHGLFEWKPITLKARLFPADAVDMPAILKELEQANVILPFRVGDKAYGAIRNFCKYQRPRRPSYQHPLAGEVASYVGSEAISNAEIPDNVGNGDDYSVPDPDIDRPKKEDGFGIVGNNSIKGAAKPTPRSVLESILDAKRSSALIDHRQRKKSSLGLHAAELLVRRLALFADPNAAADLMIEKGWASIEPDWAPGLARAAPTVSTGEARTTWVTDDDQRWPALAARYAADHGRSLSPISSKHAAGLGWHFPNEWLAESERAA
jgi:hypothetical protein